jgi:leucyl-tRNA synthetase
MKDYWTIERNEKGGLFVQKVAEMSMLPDWIKTDEEYGIKFATEGQAEKAVEKLKAWKRLKDNGFKFTGVTKLFDGDWNKITFNKDQDETWIEENKADLELLFGSEE